MNPVSLLRQVDPSAVARHVDSSAFARVADPRWMLRAAAAQRWVLHVADPRWALRDAPRRIAGLADPRHIANLADPRRVARLADPSHVARLTDPRYVARLADPRSFIQGAAPDELARRADLLRARLGRRLVDEVGGVLARALANVPDDQLHDLMHSPARRVLLDGLFRGAPSVLDRTPVGKWVTSLRVHVTSTQSQGVDVYWLRYSDGRWRSGRGVPEVDPYLTLIVDGVELVRMGTGRSTPVQAFLSGRLRASGNPLIAARLMALARAMLAPRPPAL